MVKSLNVRTKESGNNQLCGELNRLKEGVNEMNRQRGWIGTKKRTHTVK